MKNWGKPSFYSIPIEARFVHAIKIGDDCWEWLMTKNRYGYGQISRHGIMKLAHRISYELFVGQIPEGKHVLHTCDNPQCCNPKHLWIGTPKDNMVDMVNKGRHVRPIKAVTKITRIQMEEIKSLIGVMKQCDIAEIYGVSAPYISSIKHGRIMGLKYAH